MFLQEIIPLPIILYVSCIKKNVTDIEKGIKIKELSIVIIWVHLEKEI